jgi:Carboxypeptidase regulatory-like domain
MIIRPVIRLFALWIFLVALCFVPGSARAQTGSITGTVKDSTGALVPEVKISARNTATNASRTAQTDDSGTYRITSLVPGIYDVLIEKDGFKTVEFLHVVLTVDLVQNLDATLVPSSVTAKVTVTGESVAPIDLNDAQVGNMVTSEQIMGLPLVLRDPYQLALLSPGANASNSILGGLSVNGSRERNNNFLLDGTDNNDADIPGLSQPQPGLTSLNPDAVQEFRVITSNMLPEFGRNSGAVVDIITKSGTNELHSDLYWFGRYDALGARDFFNHKLDATGQVLPKDSYTRNIFGGSAGGPIIHDKTFWFANYEGERFSTTLTNHSIVPTQAFKSGKFTFAGTPIDVSSPGAANNIFGLTLDPTMQKLLALYPAPNGPPVDDARGLLYFPSPSTTTGDNVTAHVDHKLSSSETLMVLYAFNRFEDPNFAHTDYLPELGGTGTRQRRQNGTLRLISLISQDLVNDLRFGANRINFPLTCQGVSTFDQFGPADSFGRGLDYFMPANLAGFGCILLTERDGSQRFSGTYTTGDSVTWTAGQHTLKGGFEFRDVYSNSYDNFVSRPLADFQNLSNFGVPAFQTVQNPDCSPSNPNPPVDCNPLLQNMVWTLFGVEGSQTQAQFFDKAGNRRPNDLRGFRQRELAAFFQDTFKALPNLTLNYGLRYQFNGVPFEVNNLLSTLYTDPSGSGPFTFAIAGDAKGLPPLYNNDWHDFEPRIGIAWDPFSHGSTSMRAGYGIFHDRMFGQLLGLTRGNPPFQQVFFQPLFGPPTIAPTGLSCTPPQRLSNNPSIPLCLGPQVSSGFLPPPLATSPTVSNGAGILPFLVDPHLRMPYSQNWMMGVQHELTGGVLVEINYIGSRGTRLLRVVDGNPPQPALVAKLEAYCNSQSTPQAIAACQNTLQFSNLYFGLESGVPAFVAVGSDAVNSNAFFHTDSFTGAASSIYNALQTNITKRLAHGLAFQASYTWSHAIDSASDPLVPTQGGQTFPRNSFNLAAERGNSDFDVRHRLTLNYIWQVPLGSGHAHLSEGFAGKVLAGWQIAGISTFATGLPFDMFTAVDAAHTGFVSRPDYNPLATPAAVPDPGLQTGPNPGLFSTPPFDRGGYLSRNHFYGPGINNWDLVLQKTTRLSERISVELRTEVYNLFNRVQFNQPDNFTSDAQAFGQSNGQVGRPDGTSGARQLQFGLRLKF